MTKRNFTKKIMQSIFIAVAFIFTSCTTTNVNDVEEKCYSDINNPYTQKFYELAEIGEYDKLLPLIEKWKVARPNDSDWYECAFSIYSFNSLNSLSYKSEYEDLAKTSDNSSERSIYINPEEYNLCIETISKGLKLYPDRLDMWLNLINYLQSIEYYSESKETVLGCIKQCKKNNNNWFATFDLPVESEYRNEETKDFYFFEDMYRNAIEPWFSIPSEETLSYADEVYGKLFDIIKDKSLLPDLYNTVAVDYFNVHAYDYGKKYLDKGYKADPDNLNINLNLASYYIFAERDEDKAKKYINVLIDSGDPDYLLDIDALLNELYNK